MKRTLLSILVVAIVAAAAAHAAPKDPPPALGEGKGQVVLSWDEFVKITGYDPSKPATTLTIPWSQVEDLLGVKVDRVGEGSTVDLPWTEFKALLEWSVKQKAPEEEAPPTDYVVVASEYAGKLSEKMATFTLTVKIEILRKKGWKQIPLLPIHVALVKASLPDGVYLHSNSGNYALLTDKSGSIDVSVEFSVATKRTAGVNQVTFQRVAPGSSMLDLTIDQADADVTVAGAQSQVVKTDKGATHVAAAIPSNTPVSVSWQRALPKVAAAPAKLYAETRALVAVAEGVLLCQETVNFNILHSPVRELKLTVPEGAGVLAVSGRNIKDWQVGKQNDLLVVLSSEVIGSYDLRLSYEQLIRDGVEAPVLHPVGVERAKGYVGVVALANVELGVGEVSGATSIDARQLPGDIVAMTNQPILLAFRYLGKDVRIPLTIRKHGEVSVLVTIADSALLTVMQLNDGRRMTKVIYSVRNNRNQFLRMKMPPGVELWSMAVGGKPVSPAADQAGNVLIPLIRSRQGTSELAAFPVELVYVETPAKVPPPAGKLRVKLPTLDTPVMHVMMNYYLPAEGDYTVPVGLFGRKSGFGGPLRVVTKFAKMATGRGATIVSADAAKRAKAMQQQFDQRVAAQARAAGATPIRVRLPIDGRLFRLEKILALPQDELYVEVRYRGWKVTE